MYALYLQLWLTCLILLTSCTEVAYDNYNTIEIHEAFIIAISI
jgi:hypothetical protein